MKASSEKEGLVTQVTPLQNIRKKKPGKGLREGLNESTGPQTSKRNKGSPLNKVKQMRRAAETVGKNHAAAISLTPDVEAWRKVGLRKWKDRKKIRPEVIIIFKRRVIF